VSPLTTEKFNDAGADPQAGTVTLRSPHVVIAGLIASLAPLALLTVNRNWIFTPEAFLDPWHYVGFFREYLNPNYAPGAYKLARLPWILAGYLAHSVLSPIHAAYVLHGFFLSLTSLALFVGLYALFRRVALAGVVATMLGFYTHAHGSGGWDYHNTAAGGFYLLAFMLLALPGAIAGRRPHLMLAGAVSALAVHSNITLVNFLPALALVHLQAVQVHDGRLPPIRALLARCGWSALGAVLVTLALGIVNAWAGREFLFFALLAQITAQYVADPHRVAGWRPASGWIWTATHLALPAAVFLVGTVTVVIHRGTSARRRLARSLILQFLAMSLVWAGWEMVGELALSWNYFAYVLIPSCFIAIGGLLAMTWPDFCERHWLTTILATAVACGLCVGGAASEPRMQSFVASVAHRLAMVGCVFFVAGLGTFLLRPAVATLLVFIGVFAVGNRLVSADPLAYLVQDPCKIRADIYAAIVEGASDIGEIDPTYTRARTWFEQNETIHPTGQCAVSLGAMSGSMTTMAFVPYITAPWPMPDVNSVPEAAVRSLVASDAILAIITSRQENIDAWNHRLDRMNLQHHEIAHRRVPFLQSGFSVYAWEISQNLPEGTTFGAPILALTDKTPAGLNVYGTPKGVLSTEGDRVVFKPTDTRDHVAYPFAMFPRPVTDQWVRVTIALPVSASNAPSCRVVIQNPSLTSLAMIPCMSSTRYLKLPPQTPGVRVYLTDARRQKIILPRRLEIALSDPGQ